MALRWTDLDFERGFITLQGATAKKRKTETVPMNPTARGILEMLDRTESPFVFPGQDPEKPRTNLRRMARRVKRKAGMPADYRPLYCLRHTFASWLASSGQVSMYELQRLMTHEDPKMTQRYAHLHDDALRRASGVADGIFQEAVNAGPVAPASGKVVQLRKGGRTARKAG
jgi:integrase